MQRRPSHPAKSVHLAVPGVAETMFHHLANAIYRRWPRPSPPVRRLRSCRIVSHRGEHDNRRRFENTLAAFDAAEKAGVWGIELDVRWTRDREPVVFHDASTRRLFQEDAQIAAMTGDQLRRRFPLVPTLAAVAQRYGGRLHLMVEIKARHRPVSPADADRVHRALAHLNPIADFHLMSLEPSLLVAWPQLPAAARIPIAQAQADRFSRMTMANGWGGLAGHYLMVTRRHIHRHHRHGQQVGTGFVDSRRCLYREVSRGVDWIFSNRAAAIQAACRHG